MIGAPHVVWSAAACLLCAYTAQILKPPTATIALNTVVWLMFMIMTAQILKSPTTTIALNTVVWLMFMIMVAFMNINGTTVQLISETCKPSSGNLNFDSRPKGLSNTHKS